MPGYMENLSGAKIIIKTAEIFPLLDYNATPRVATTRNNIGLNRKKHIDRCLCELTVLQNICKRLLWENTKVNINLHKMS